MSFLREMTDALKQAAPRQLVLIGSEGFFAQDDPNSAFNPGGRVMSGILPLPSS